MQIKAFNVICGQNYITELFTNIIKHVCVQRYERLTFSNVNKSNKQLC